MKAVFRLLALFVYIQLDVSGLERIGDWTKKIPRVTQKKCQAKGKHNVTEPVNTFSCLESACIATFKTIEEADEHMDTGHHIMTPEKETIYNNVPRQWAAVTTSVKVAGQKIGGADYVPLGNLRLIKGWALKKQKAVVRISSGVKEFLTNLFNKGAKDLHQKAMPADVVEQIKKTFPVSEWVEVQTVRGYFSRRASHQKGLPVSEEEDEDKALEKEDYMEQLVGWLNKRLASGALLYMMISIFVISLPKTQSASVILRVF